MPLQKGKSRETISHNISTLTGEIGKSPHVKSHKQAIAIALSEARRSARAKGGRDKGEHHHEKHHKINWDRSTVGRGSPIRKDQTVLDLPTSKVHSLWKRDKDYYVNSPKQSVRDYAATGSPMSLPEIGSGDNRIQFQNGRNRFALAHALGHPTVPMAVDNEDIDRINSMMDLASGGRTQEKGAARFHFSGAKSGRSAMMNTIKPPQHASSASRLQGIDDTVRHLDASHPLFGAHGPGLFGDAGFRWGGVSDDDRYGPGLFGEGPPEDFSLGGGPGDMLGAFPGAGAAAAEFKGPIHSHIAGRTDKIKMDVKPGSYVVPADVVSAVGQGNTTAGQETLKKLFSPTGISGMTVKPARPPTGHGVGLKMQEHGPKPHRMKRHAEGGRAEPVKIIAAGGEHVISPEDIEAKFGSLNHGHNSLDEFVHEIRRREMKRLASQPPPKGSQAEQAGVKGVQ
jgi:Family of unknown function (DUF6496)